MKTVYSAFLLQLSLLNAKQATKWTEQAIYKKGPGSEMWYSMHRHVSCLYEFVM